MNKKQILFTLFTISLITTNIQMIQAQNGVLPQTNLYDGLYQNNYLAPKWSFNKQALGSIGNLTITNMEDHAINATLFGLEGFVIISTQNRTIITILGVFNELNNGAVSYFPRTWVQLDAYGGEQDTVILVVWGCCIGPYDVTPQSGELDVLMPQPINSIDSFENTRDFVEYSNRMDYPSSFSMLDTALTRSVLFFALTSQDVSPERLQNTYSRFDVDSIVDFSSDSLVEHGVNVENIPMFTSDLGDRIESGLDPRNPLSKIPGFPLPAMVMSFIVVLWMFRVKPISE